MNLKDFHSFQMVYEAQSINNAAKRLFISPQGLGKIIKNLEEEYKTTFFIRTKNGVLPTESAHVFYHWSKEILSDVSRMSEELNQLGTQRRKIRIGFSNGVLKAISLDIILQFIQDNKDIAVEWCEYENNTLVKKIESGEIEYGLVIGRFMKRELIQHKVHQNNIVLLVYEGHPFYQKEYVTMDMLREENILVMNEQFHIYEDFIRACKIQGFEPRIKAKTMDGGTLFHLCGQKMGLAIAPDFPNEQVEGVRAVPFREPYHWNIYGTYQENRVEDEVIHRVDQCLMTIRNFTEDESQYSML